MISYSEAKSCVLAHAHRPEPVSLPLLKLSGLIMAENAIAPYDLPRFSQSAKDGYGVRRDDVTAASTQNPIRLNLQGLIQAGEAPQKTHLPGHAVRIFTGAPVPAGVDAIIMQEHCQAQANQIIVTACPEPGEHIRPQGEEFRQGDIVLSAGTRITPPVVGLLAMLGYSTFPVYGPPRVALVMTGNELCPPGQPLKPGQVYEANSYALRAALGELGISDSAVWFVRDEATDTLENLSQALANHDVVITVGGISVGEFDLVKSTVENLGVHTVFWRIAMKPGKPVYFGIHEADGHRKLVFGLPGNPVSALVTFHEFVRPALLAMMGIPQPNVAMVTAELAQPLTSQAGRRDLARGRLMREQDRLTVFPMTGQDSHMLGGLASADCLIHLPEADCYVRAGQVVETEPIRWQG